MHREHLATWFADCHSTGPCLHYGIGRNARRFNVRPAFRLAEAASDRTANVRPPSNGGSLPPIRAYEHFAPSRAVCKDCLTLIARTDMRPIDQLERTIQQRKNAGDADASYTARLLAGGVVKIGGKVTEEAAEVVEAAAEPGEAGRTHTIAEAGDLLYHLLVLLAARDVELAQVEAELARRFGVSGIEEKASRSQAVDPTSP